MYNAAQRIDRIVMLSIALLMALTLLIHVPHSFGQSLVLRGMPHLEAGSGDCSTIRVGIASERWRVRKGDLFEVSAFAPFQDTPEFQYEWNVDNGKIISGQGKESITIKAGGRKTPGYLNATGFVGMQLTVRPRTSSPCSVSVSASIMIGKYRESNAFSKVESTSLSKGVMTASCDQADDSSMDITVDDTLVDVLTTASDPENDPLTCQYVVSAGKIIGRGAKVKWDLSDAPIGTHRILVGTDDGNGIHSVGSAAIDVIPCA
jgi:hypothetical protein